MDTFRYEVTEFWGSHYFARIRALNEHQASALLEQNFPDRETYRRLNYRERLPRNEEWFLDLV